MGRRYFLSFSTEKYQQSQNIAVTLAQGWHLDTSFTFNEHTLKEHFPEFFSAHQEILSKPRGFGYWLWKPFLLSWLLDRLADSDVVMYADSGILFIEDPSALFSIAEQNEQLLFVLPGQINERWVKRDLFCALGADVEECWKREQTAAFCSLWKVCPSSRQRVKEWFQVCTNYHLLNDEPSIAPNFPVFKEHRHDQSVLSVLSWKWGAELFPNPTQVGESDRERWGRAGYRTLAWSVGAIQENGQLANLWPKYIGPALERAQKVIGIKP